MRSNTIAGPGLGAALLVVACSQGRDQAGGTPADTSTTTAQKPPPFDKGPVKIALVQYSGAGDYFELWTKGATAQADAVGFSMQRYDAEADDARQAADMTPSMPTWRPPNDLPPAMTVNPGASRAAAATAPRTAAWARLGGSGRLEPRSM